MAVVKKQAGKHLVAEMTQAAGEVVPRGFRVFQGVFPAQLFLQVAARHLQHGLQLGIGSGTKAVMAAELGLAGIQQGPQATPGLQQVTRQIDGGFAVDAGAQENGEQFGVGEGGRPAGQQFFAWPFIRRPVPD